MQNTQLLSRPVRSAFPPSLLPFCTPSFCRFFKIFYVFLLTTAKKGIKKVYSVGIKIIQSISVKDAAVVDSISNDNSKPIERWRRKAIGHYTYDTKLADEITSGKVSKYIPDTSATLNSSKGICYDLSSLFAAMCRSQSIPCSLTKGYAGRSYHAWNKVNVDGAWYQIDLTYAVTERVLNANSLSDCVSPLHYAQQSDSLAIAA